MRVEIVIDRNYVIIEGVKIERPTRVAPSQWLWFWELYY